MLTSAGLDPSDNAENTATPARIGNLAENSVVRSRENDGVNRLGNEGGVRFNRLLTGLYRL